MKETICQKKSKKIKDSHSLRRRLLYCEKEKKETPSVNYGLLNDTYFTLANQQSNSSKGYLIF
jgi:hypothetical protein